MFGALGERRRHEMAVGEKMTRIAPTIFLGIIREPNADQGKTRVDELKRDYEAGHARLARLELEAAQLRETLLRINGSIQAPEETIAAKDTHPESK